VLTVFNRLYVYVAEHKIHDVYSGPAVVIMY
jgi:hypothetical protein